MNTTMNITEELQELVEMTNQLKKQDANAPVLPKCFYKLDLEGRRIAGSASVPEKVSMTHVTPEGKVTPTHLASVLSGYYKRMTNYSNKLITC